MAEALIRGLVKGGHVSSHRITASAPRNERLAELVEAYGIAVTRDNRDVAKQSIVVLSVKPQIMDKVLREVGDQLSPSTLVISIAAGVDTETIEHAVPEGVHVIRAMPNTPAKVGAGATAISPGKDASESDLALARA